MTCYVFLTKIKFGKVTVVGRRKIDTIDEQYGVNLQNEEANGRLVQVEQGSSHMVYYIRTCTCIHNIIIIIQQVNNGQSLAYTIIVYVRDWREEKHTIPSIYQCHTIPYHIPVPYHTIHIPVPYHTIHIPVPCRTIQ